jgi:hypothetical protein
MAKVAVGNGDARHRLLEFGKLAYVCMAFLWSSGLEMNGLRMTKPEPPNTKLHFRAHPRGRVWCSLMSEGTSGV